MTTLPEIFSHGGKEYIFQGQVPNFPSLAHFHQLKRLCAIDVIQECFALQWDDTWESIVSPSLTSYPSELTALLQSYQIVFSIPTTLPPP